MNFLWLPILTVHETKDSETLKRLQKHLKWAQKDCELVFLVGIVHYILIIRYMVLNFFVWLQATICRWRQNSCWILVLMMHHDTSKQMVESKVAQCLNLHFPCVSVLSVVNHGKFCENRSQPPCFFLLVSMMPLKVTLFIRFLYMVLTHLKTYQYFFFSGSTIFPLSRPPLCRRWNLWTSHFWTDPAGSGQSWLRFRHGGWVYPKTLDGLEWKILLKWMINEVPLF